MRNNGKLFVIATALAVCLCGCQKSPESSIVTNKDFDNMIDEAENTENGSSDVGSLAENYDTYQTTIKDESLKVTVNVDAKVDIPETEKMSVFRVSQKNFDQAFLDKFLDTLTPGVAYYEGWARSALTKGAIESEIQMYKGLLADVDAYVASREWTEEDGEVMREDYQYCIDELQSQYESAPETIDVKNYPSDGQIQSVESKYNADPDNEYYSWQYELNPNGEIYYGASDAEDGNYRSIYIQNNEDYGNCMRYRSSSQGQVWVSSVYAGNGIEPGMWKDGEDFGDDVSLPEGARLEETSDEPVTISVEQAKQKADELMSSLGFTDFECSDSGLYCEISDIRTGNTDSTENVVKYRKVYRLCYMRNIDGVFVNNEGGSKHSEGWDGDSYIKKDWPGESIVIYVNDSGIVGFDYAAPIEILETVVDQSNMKSFDEIKGIFEQMVVVTNARTEEDINVTIDIDRVVLRYTRISEANSFDTGLLVPVWDFDGIVTDEYGSVFKEANVLTINAIDGSVIDRELGY